MGAWDPTNKSNRTFRGTEPGVCAFILTQPAAAALLGVTVGMVVHQITQPDEVGLSKRPFDEVLAIMEQCAAVEGDDSGKPTHAVVIADCGVCGLREPAPMEWVKRPS